MSKWYQPFGLLLVSAMIANLGGCAQTSGWLAKKNTKNSGDQKVASTDKKAGDKTAKAKPKSSKDSADTKVADARDNKATKKPSTKSVDTEHDKYTAADRPKKPKPAAATAEKGEVRVAASTKPAKPAASKAKAESQDNDDGLDAFLTKIEPASDVAKKPARKQETADTTERATSKTASKQDVVQVKKEFAKGEDDDATDWADIKSPAETGSSKPSKDADSFDSESDESFEAKPKKAPLTDDVTPADNAWETPASTNRTAKKAVVKKSGLEAQCPDASPQLAELLCTLDPADPESLKQGLHRIGQLGKDGVPAGPLLKKMLKHEDPFVRVHAALAMARLRMSSPESVVVVTESLKSRDASLRSFSSNVLVEMGPRTNDVLAALAESLKDPDGQIRIRVAEVLIRHDEWSYKALQTLLGCLRAKDDDVRWMATFSLAELAPESQEAVQALMKATHDPVHKVRLGAVRALAEIGPFAKPTSGDLARLLESTNDEELKSAIRYAMQQMDEPAQ